VLSAAEEYAELWRDAGKIARDGNFAEFWSVTGPIAVIDIEVRSSRLYRVCVCSCEQCVSCVMLSGQVVSGRQSEAGRV
jgi:hypothetical protein